MYPVTFCISETGIISTDFSPTAFAAAFKFNSFATAQQFLTYKCEIASIGANILNTKKTSFSYCEFVMLSFSEICYFFKTVL